VVTGHACEIRMKYKYDVHVT